MLVIEYLNVTNQLFALGNEQQSHKVDDRLRNGNHAYPVIQIHD